MSPSTKVKLSFNPREATRKQPITDSIKSLKGNFVDPPKNTTMSRRLNVNIPDNFSRTLTYTSAKKELGHLHRPPC